MVRKAKDGSHGDIQDRDGQREEKEQNKWQLDVHGQNHKGESQ